MAVEAKRGCGFRKVGGLYLVSDPGGVPCDRLPIPLTVCPTCSCGIKQALGWTWVDVAPLIQGRHGEACQEFEYCPLCDGPESMGRAGLLWVGEKFYPNVADFERESRELGVSKRIRAVPREFKVGQTWVLLAHPRAVTQTCEGCSGTGQIIAATAEEDPACEACEGEGRVIRPGIFKVWRPQRVEKILPESLRGSEEAEELAKRGIQAVYVPDGDSDHQGTVYDKTEEEKQ